MAEDALYRAVFGRTRHPMSIVDDDGVLLDLNRSTAALTGWRRADAVGRDRRDYVVAEDRAKVDEQQAALRRHDGWVGVYRIRSAAGGPITMEVAADPDIAPGHHLVLYTPVDDLVDGHDTDERGVVSASAVEVPSLTDRERQVVTELALGATGPEIAGALHITVDTVRTHVRNAMARTGTRTRTHLAIVALRRGLIHPEAPSDA